MTSAAIVATWIFLASFDVICLITTISNISLSQLSNSIILMARGNCTLPIRFFKIILQTNLQRLKIPNKFTRRHGVGLSNPVLIKPPDGTKWKVYWKKINGEIWFEKGWRNFTQNYSLQHGCLVVFKYKEGTSKFNVLILGQNTVEIDYDSACDTDENDEWQNQKSTRKRSPLYYPRPHKKVSGVNRTKLQEVAAKFISSNPFFTILIQPNHLLKSRPGVPNLNLKEIIHENENKEENLVLQLGERSWNVKLLPCYKHDASRRLSAGWSLFASESGLQPEDVCVFELINKEDLVFKVHVF